ncbi:hypothetical protein ACFQ78_34215 [Streptomyces sp. NPDC056519]|uniref:hypothetical protein n=1 Tax=Streptomyces sp. NPDC056519 TaxID=3345849 RepID=UPI0036ABE308
MPSGRSNSPPPAPRDGPAPSPAPRKTSTSLSLRALFDEQASLRRAVRVITHRLAAPCSGRPKAGVRGYPNQAERFEKQRRLQVLTARLAAVEARAAAARPEIVVGGRRLLGARHDLVERA